MNINELKHKNILLENIQRIINSKKTIALAQLSKERKKINSINESQEEIKTLLSSIEEDIMGIWYSIYGYENSVDTTLWIIPCPSIELLEDIREGYIEEINKLVKTTDYLLLIGDIDQYKDHIKCKNKIYFKSRELSEINVRNIAGELSTEIATFIFDSGLISSVKTLLIHETEISWKTQTILPFRKSTNAEVKNKIDYSYLPSLPLSIKVIVHNLIKNWVIKSVADIYIFELKSKLVLYQTSLRRIDELKLENRLLGFKKRQEKITLEIQNIVTAFKAIQEDDI